MNPALMHEIARYRQADMLREEQRARLAHLASETNREPRGFFRLFRFLAAPVPGRPALNH